MKRLLLILALLLPLTATAQSLYYDHRSPRLDSLEAVTERYTPDELAAASEEELRDLESGHTARALQYLSGADDYFGSHAREELQFRYETVVWYRKRLLAKFDVHTSPALIAEVTRRGLL